ncbi:MAG: type II secretion system F family protein [Planctomycetota bacterium]|nr:type II secretion system F family protein [Planctomycetota bacterium]
MADDVGSAAAVLRSQGSHVLQLVPMADRAAPGIGRVLAALNWSSGPTTRDILDFTTQLAVMIRAGISLRQALDGIGEQVTNVKFKRMIQEIKSDVESGKQFSEAIAKFPGCFNPLYVNMVRASEMSGSFAKMLDRIAAFMTQQMETRKMVVSASIYPGIIAIMAVSVTIFLLTFVLPRFAGVFQGKEDVLPWPTIFLMGLSSWMVEYWWAVLVGLLLGVVGFVAGGRTTSGRRWIDHGKLRMPLFRGMFRALYVSRSLQTMGELLNAGVPVLDSITVTADITGNVHYRSLWLGVHSSVKQGRKIHSELDRSTLLPASVNQMISAGEESGKLSEVLQEISEYYAGVLRNALKTLTSMIEPLLIVVMGSVVGFIAMAIILPIFKMSSIVSG